MILEQYYDKATDNQIEVTKRLIDRLYTGNLLNQDDFLKLLNNINFETSQYLFLKACEIKEKYYQNKVYIRGLIEISNYCRKDCLYCGIRNSNNSVTRYRYTIDEIIEIIDDGYLNGYRTFVLQGGEDSYFNDEILVELISKIKSKYFDIAITLSLGERTYDSYEKLSIAGANRYLLRHETASSKHYELLHPKGLSLENRINCLKNLKSLGYQVGAGFMVDSPYQTNNDLVSDFIFIQQFQPHMIGIGPFVTHKDTPLKEFKSGDINKVIICYALARLVCPMALIPSTTATSSIDKEGRIKALNAGCNVIMINLSKLEKRKNYSLYDNKSYKGDESEEYKQLIKNDIESCNLVMSFEVGHHFQKQGAK